MPVTQDFHTHRSDHGQALRAPSYVDARVLTADTNETHPIPEGAKVVVFSATADFYARYDGGDAAEPSADVEDGTASELNPTVRYLDEGVTEIDLIAPAGAIVTMAFFKG